MEASVEHGFGSDTIVCPRCGHEQLCFGPRCVACDKVLVAGEAPAGKTAAAALSHNCEESYYGEYANGSCSPLAAVMNVTAQREPEPVALGVDRGGLVALGIGLAAAAASFLSIWTIFIFSHLNTAIHEFGHAAAGWLFGYFSIPAYDFMFGGGVTISSERLWLIVGIVYLLFGLAAYHFRGYRPALYSVCVTAAVYTGLMLSSWHEAIIIAVGHGAELVFAGIFLYRAISGRTLMTKLERPVYAFLGFFIVLENSWLAWKLIDDYAFRNLYSSAKGGLMAMDYSRLADDYWHVSLKTVAIIFLVLTLITPLIAWVLAVFRRRLIEPILGD